MNADSVTSIGVPPSQRRTRSPMWHEVAGDVPPAGRSLSASDGVAPTAKDDRFGARETKVALVG